MLTRHQISVLPGDLKARRRLWQEPHCFLQPHPPPQKQPTREHRGDNPRRQIRDTESEIRWPNLTEQTSGFSLKLVLNFLSLYLYDSSVPLLPTYPYIQNMMWMIPMYKTCLFFLSYSMSTCKKPTKDTNFTSVSPLHQCITDRPKSQLSPKGQKQYIQLSTMSLYTMDHLKADDVDCQTGFCTRQWDLSGWLVSWVKRPCVYCVLWSAGQHHHQVYLNLSPWKGWQKLTDSHRQSIWQDSTKSNLGGSVDIHAYCDPPFIQLVASVLLCTLWTTAGENLLLERTTTNSTILCRLCFEIQSIILIGQCNGDDKLSISFCRFVTNAIERWYLSTVIGALFVTKRYCTRQIPNGKFFTTVTLDCTLVSTINTIESNSCK